MAAEVPVDHPLYHYASARAHWQAQRFAQAADFARVSVERETLPPAAWYDLGLILQSGGDLHGSRACLECAIALRANVPAAHLVLGNTLKLLGDFEGAARVYRAAIAEAPDFVEAHANAAIALHVLGKNADALTHAARAIELAPDLVEPRITHALIVGRVHGFAAALHLLVEILDRDPDHGGALSALVVALVRLERFDEAASLARRALTVQPHDPKLHEMLGLCLRMSGRYDEARTAIDQAERLSSDRSSVLAGKAEFLMELGRMAEAEEALLEALSLRPDLASAWFNLAGLRTFEPGDPLIAAMERTLELAPRLAAVDDRMIMHFALGSAQLKAGDADAGFVHLTEGNALRRRSIEYDVASDERFMASIAERFGPELFARLSGTGSAVEAPIFVIGMPRSGTSLTEQIIASHPDVYGAGEVSHLMDTIVADGRGYPELADGLQAHDLAALRTAYLARFGAHRSSGKRIVDKLPSNFLYAGLIHLMFPRARIVHTRRDPLDTCFSCYQTLFSGRQDFAYEVTELARYYRAYDRLSGHWRSVLGDHVLLEVRYEDIVSDLRGSVERLLAFCRLPWDDACLRFHETSRPVRTASKNQVRKPLYATSVGRAARYPTHLAPLADALSGGPR